MQPTYPQTLGCGLNDSPAGLAPWIVEKFRAWSDCGGEVERRFTKDELLHLRPVFTVVGGGVVYDPEQVLSPMKQEEDAP